MCVFFMSLSYSCILKIVQSWFECILFQNKKMNVVYNFIVFSSFHWMKTAELFFSFSHIVQEPH